MAKPYHSSQEQVHCEVCGRWGTNLRWVDNQNRCENHRKQGRR